MDEPNIPRRKPFMSSTTGRMNRPIPSEITSAPMPAGLSPAEREIWLRSKAGRVLRAIPSARRSAQVAINGRKGGRPLTRDIESFKCCGKDPHHKTCPRWIAIKRRMRRHERDAMQDLAGSN